MNWWVLVAGFVAEALSTVGARRRVHGYYQAAAAALHFVNATLGTPLRHRVNARFSTSLWPGQAAASKGSKSAPALGRHISRPLYSTPRRASCALHVRG